MEKGDYVKVDLGMGLYAYGNITRILKNSWYDVRFLDGSQYDAKPSEILPLSEKELFTVKLSLDKKIHDSQTTS